jgi:prepilin-type N-terminal cleavage/methylation domain-containing protein
MLFGTKLCWRKPSWRNPAFSMVELLITLGLIGILAAFTVPKVLSPSTNTVNSKYTAITRDVAFMISSAYERYRMANATVSTTVDMIDLFPYMPNYVQNHAGDASIVIDNRYGTGTITCSNPGNPCLRLHNGGVLYLWGNDFNGTASTNAVLATFDPDGKVTSDGSAYTEGKGMHIFIYYDGRVADYGTIKSNTVAGASTYNPNSGNVQPWFSGF